MEHTFKKDCNGLSANSNMCLCSGYVLIDEFFFPNGSHFLSPSRAWYFLISCQTLWNLHHWVLDMLYSCTCWTLSWDAVKYLEANCSFWVLLCRFVSWAGAGLILRGSSPHYRGKTYSSSLLNALWVLRLSNLVLRNYSRLLVKARPCCSESFWMVLFLALGGLLTGVSWSVLSWTPGQISCRVSAFSLWAPLSYLILWPRTGLPWSSQSLNSNSVTHRTSQAAPEWALQAPWPGTSPSTVSQAVR